MGSKRGSLGGMSADRRNALKNNSFYQLYFKEYSTYDDLFQEKLNSLAVQFADKYDYFKLKSISGKITFDYLLESDLCEVKAKVQANMRWGHMDCQKNAKTAAFVDKEADFIQLEDGSAIVHRENSEDESFSDYVSGMLDYMAEVCVSSIFSNFPDKCDTLELARDVWKTMYGISMRDSADYFNKHYVEKCLPQNMAQLEAYASEVVLKKFELAPPEYLPEGALKANVSISDFNAELDYKSHFNVEFKIHVSYDNGLSADLEAFNVSRILCPILLFNRADKIFINECKHSIEKAAQYEVEKIPPYISDETSFSEKIRRFFSLGEVRENGVSGQSPLHSNNDSPFFISWDSSVCMCQGSPIERTSHIATLADGFYMDLGKPEYSIESKACPNDNYELTYFLDQADQLYGNMQLEGLENKPNVEFSIKYDGSILCEVSTGSKYQLLSDGEHTIAELLKELFQKILTEELEDQNLESVYVKALNDANLNRLEMAVLEYTCNYHGTWKSNTQEFLKEYFPVSSSAAEMCLNKLCHLVLRDADPVETALIAENKESSYSRYGTYLFYTTPDKLSPSLFESKQLSIRQFNVDDFSYFSRKGQEWMCSNVCVEARTTDEKMTALQMFEKLPKTAIVRFAQTGEGLNFFRSLDGDVRTYASSMLSRCNDKTCTSLSNELSVEI